MERHPSYPLTRQHFAWDVPARLNIARVICDRHTGTALITLDAAGEPVPVSFSALREMACRLANALIAAGVQPGDRVAILLPQQVETAVAHIAAYRIGAVALPMFPLFGPEAIAYRLQDSGARVLITDADGVAKLDGIAPPLVISVDGRGDGVMGFQDLLGRASPQHTCADTAADDPAILMYTSGTTGQPKGVLQAHRIVLGMLPGVELPHDYLPQPGDCLWTPADWAWAGGLLDVLLPGLFHGVPVVAHRARKFDPGAACAMMARAGVRNAFLPPTALKLMRAAGVRAAPLRSVGSGGERLGDTLLDWGRGVFGTTINEFYGQTECNLVVGGCATLFPPKPGAMGRPIPGYDVAVLDDAMAPVLDQPGEIAVRAPNPALFLRYWNNPDATARKLRRDAQGGLWLMTGDLGRMGAEGDIWFQGRDDDVISSAGYRIGPDEIEACIAQHSAVAMVAVIGVPDPVRGEAVKAFVVVAPGHAATPDIAASIRAFVKSRLSPHEYPRVVEFRDELPMTVTGKIRRRDLRD